MVLDPKDLKKRLVQLGLELSRLFATISALWGDFPFYQNYPSNKIQYVKPTQHNHK